MLDTNVVLDLFHFDDPATRPLADALEAGLIRCAASPATMAEWRRVLGYPGFGLDAAAQAAIDARYIACVSLVAEPGTGMGLPRCRDADDQKFLELAAAIPAVALVSKDRALLDLRRRCAPQFRIMSPAEAVRWLNAPLRHQSTSAN